jgi:SNF2 family DNA or RNA helicase
MTLTLANLGPVELVATTGGLKVSSQVSRDLTSRSNWPTEALQHPDGLKTALEVEQCLELGFAQVDGESVLIPYASFPEVRRSGIGITTHFGEWSPFLLKIERISDIGRADFLYHYSFIYEGQTIAFDRIGYFGVRAGAETAYQLDDQTYALVSEMDRFNALPAQEKTRSESWLAFSRVKECATDVGASLDRYLQSNDVIVPKSVQLDIHEWPDGTISFAPQINGIEGDGLKRAFFHSPTAENFYNVDGPNNSRVRVVFDDRQTEVLQRMKGVHRAYGKLKQRLLDEPEVVFEGLMDAVEIRYGRRVEGIGALEAQSIPGASRSKSVLELGPKGPDDSPSRTSAMSEASPSQASQFGHSLRRDFISEAKHAIEAGQDRFVFNGRPVEIDAGVKDLIAAEEEKATRDVDQKGETKDGKKYLLPYKDEEDLKSWDVEDADRARLPIIESFPLQTPRALNASVKLKKYQEEGILWLQTCHRLRPHRRGSLLADDMGLGKTLQVLTYLAWCIEHDKDLQLSAPAAPWRPVLIIVPLILLEDHTWEKEINERFTGGVFDPLLVFHGASIKNLRRSDVKGPEVAIGKPAIPHEVFTKHRVVITNYQTIVNYQHSFAQLLPETQKSIWSVIVTDEAQEYKAPPTKISHAIKALHPDIHIACTGTPVENRFLDLWNLVDAIQPALLGTSEEFRERYERGESPLSDRVTNLKQNLLFGHRNTFVMRRDKIDVLHDLPSKTIAPLYADMNDWEIEMHNELVGSIGSSSHLAVLHRLVALYQHPMLLEERGGPLEPQKLLQQSSKLRAVVAKLREIRAREEKAVIFAYRVEMQQILAAVISSEFGLNVEIINGVRAKPGSQGSSGTQSAKQNRESKLARFRQSRGFNVIILSPFVASIGLTITEANHVIHYGRWWNPAVEAQATDRVYRIGQNKPVFVHLPILRDSKNRLLKSFDESLHEMILDKQNQAREFLTPLPEEDRLGEELLGNLKGTGSPVNTSDPVTSERIDSLPPHLFEALIACLLEDQGHRTILTARSNDHGADVLSFHEGEVWIVQVKHTAKSILVGSIAMSDLMAARMSYSTPLSYSVRLMAITNGNFSSETQSEASQHGIRLLDRRELMSQLRRTTLTMGRVYTRESDRCRSFDEGIRSARQWFQR